MKLRTRLIHWKIKWFGDDRDEMVIPCKKCDKGFISHTCYDEWTSYEIYCPECDRRENGN